MAYVKVCFVVHVFNPHELNLCVDELQQILCMLFLYFFLVLLLCMYIVCLLQLYSVARGILKQENQFTQADLYIEHNKA